MKKGGRAHDDCSWLTQSKIWKESGLVGVPWNKFAFLDSGFQQAKDDDTSDGQVEEPEGAIEGDGAEMPQTSGAQGPYVRYGYLNMRQRLLSRGPRGLSFVFDALFRNLVCLEGFYSVFVNSGNQSNLRAVPPPALGRFPGI